MHLGLEVRVLRKQTQIIPLVSRVQTGINISYQRPRSILSPEGLCPPKGSRAYLTLETTLRCSSHMFHCFFQVGTMENEENRSPEEHKGQTVRNVTCAASFLLRKHLGETEALSVSDKCKDL